MSAIVPNTNTDKTNAEKPLWKIDSAQAQKTIKGLKWYLAGRKGYLILRHKMDLTQPMAFKMSRWWRFWERSPSKMEATMKSLVSILRTSYRGRIEALEDSPKKEALIVAYRMAFRSIIKYLLSKRNHIDQEVLDEVIKYLDQNLSKKIEKLNGGDVKEGYASDQFSSLVTNDTGTDDSAQKALGSGGSGNPSFLSKADSADGAAKIVQPPSHRDDSGENRVGRQTHADYQRNNGLSDLLLSDLLKVEPGTPLESLSETLEKMDSTAARQTLFKLQVHLAEHKVQLSLKTRSDFFKKVMERAYVDDIKKMPESKEKAGKLHFFETNCNQLEDYLKSEILDHEVLNDFLTAFNNELIPAKVSAKDALDTIGFPGDQSVEKTLEKMDSQTARDTIMQLHSYFSVGDKLLNLEATPNFLKTLFTKAFQCSIDQIQDSKMKATLLQQFNKQSAFEFWRLEEKNQDCMYGRKQFGAFVAELRKFDSRAAECAKFYGPAQLQGTAVLIPKAFRDSVTTSNDTGDLMNKTFEKKFDLSTGNRKFGRVGTVHELQLSKGKNVQYKHMRSGEYFRLPESSLEASLRKYESVALRVVRHGIPGVVKPIALVVRQGVGYENCQYQYIPLEPYKEAKLYLKELAKNGVNPRIEGVVMPDVKGIELGETNLSEQDRQVIAQNQMTILNALHQEGIVHGDIKPVNFLYNVEANKEDRLTLVDLGSGAKISNNLNKLPSLSHNNATPAYMHPVFGQPGENGNPVPYGPEVDMYAAAMTQLAISYGSDYRDFVSEVVYKARSGDNTASIHSESKALKEEREKTPQQSYLKCLLEVAKKCIEEDTQGTGDFATAEEAKKAAEKKAINLVTVNNALKKLHGGDLEMKFIEEAFELGMTKPTQMDAPDRKTRFADYYEGLEKLLKNPYLSAMPKSVELMSRVGT